MSRARVHVEETGLFLVLTERELLPWHEAAQMISAVFHKNEAASNALAQDIMQNDPLALGVVEGWKQHSAKTKELWLALVNEARNVAQAKGINLPEWNYDDPLPHQIKEHMPDVFDESVQKQWAAYSQTFSNIRQFLAWQRIYKSRISKEEEKRRTAELRAQQLKARVDSNFPFRGRGHYIVEDFELWTGLKRSIIEYWARVLFGPGDKGAKRTMNEIQAKELWATLKRRTHKGKKGGF